MSPLADLLSLQRLGSPGSSPLPFSMGGSPSRVTLCPVATRPDATWAAPQSPTSPRVEYVLTTPIAVSAFNTPEAYRRSVGHARLTTMGPAFVPDSPPTASRRLNYSPALN
jgi:hypothetical protein